MTHYKIYNPETKEWYDADVPSPEIACEIWGLRVNKVYVFENGKAVRTPSKERKRSAYFGG